MRHSAPFAALLGRGAQGLPAPRPVDFGPGFALPSSPNTALAAPAGSGLPAHRATPVFALPPEALRAALHRVAAARPRCTLLAEWPALNQAQWVERSTLANFPDILVAEWRPAPGGSHLILYSRSLFGWSDFGVNGRRIAAWLDALAH